jgi:hypothetical protein
VCTKPVRCKENKKGEALPPCVSARVSRPAAWPQRGLGNSDTGGRKKRDCGQVVRAVDGSVETCFGRRHGREAAEVRRGVYECDVVWKIDPKGGLCPLFVRTPTRDRA